MFSHFFRDVKYFSNLSATYIYSQDMTIYMGYTTSSTN